MNATFPFESFFRDMLFDDPFPLIDQSFCEAPQHVRRWKEFRTAIGPADLVLAYPGRVVVVEVKRYTIDEGAVAQCLRYVGAFRSEFLDVALTRGVDVSGVVVAPNITRGGWYACEGASIPFCRISPTENLRREYCSFETPWNRLLDECRMLDVTAPSERRIRARVNEVERQLKGQRIGSGRDRHSSILGGSSGGQGSQPQDGR